MGDYKILSFLLNDQFAEIQYVDEDMNTDDVAEVRTKLLSPRVFKDDVNRIVDLLCQLIDTADIHRRNPPDSFSRVSTPPLTGGE